MFRSFSQHKIAGAIFLLIAFTFFSLSVSTSQTQDLTLTVHGSTEISHVSVKGVTEDSLEIGYADQRAYLSIESITHINGKITRPDVGKGVGLGALAGGTAGFLIGLIAGGLSSDHSSDDVSVKAYTTMGGALAGAVIGALTAKNSSDIDYDLGQMSTAEKKKIFEHLLNDMDLSFLPQYPIFEYETCHHPSSSRACSQRG